MAEAVIHELVCPECGEGASGPDLEAVKAAMKRHDLKKHPKPAKVAAPKKKAVKK